MSVLRYAALQAALRSHGHDAVEHAPCAPAVLLDVGYGNGSFLREVKKRGWRGVGNDVNPTPYPGVVNVPLPEPAMVAPDGTRFPPYKVVTFFDSLEHFEDLGAARWVSHATDWIFVTVPTVPDDFAAARGEWKHLRPGEHHFHFTPAALERVFSHHGVRAEARWVGHPEDRIRVREVGHPAQSNTTTVLLRCKREEP